MSPTHWDAKIRAKVKRRGFNSDVMVEAIKDYMIY